MRDIGTIIVILVIAYFVLSIFTNLIPGPLGDLPRALWYSLLYTLRMLGQAMGLPPEYILLLGPAGSLR